MGMNEFVDHLEGIIGDIKNCELTKEDSRLVLNQF